MPGTLRIFISAGELSGDFHGSHLVMAIKNKSPDTEFFGVGSHNMESAGVKLLYDSSNWGGIGIYQNLKRAPVVHNAGRNLLRKLPSMNLNLIITIDYRVFHTALLKGLQHLKVPKLYYFAPVIWPCAVQKPLGKAYSSFLEKIKHSPLSGGNAKNRFEALSQLADKIIVAYPFSLDDYHKAGADAEFLGHPLLNVIKVEKSRDEVRQQLGIKPHDFLIGIFPGSRWHEINAHIPVIADVAAKLMRDYKHLGDFTFYVPVAHPEFKSHIANMFRKSMSNGIEKVRFVKSHDYDVFAASDIALSKTGTSVQILMALGIPTIAFYTVVSSLWYNLTKRYFLDFEFIAFPNIIAGRPIVPEFVQDDFTSSKILKSVLSLLEDENKRSLMRKELLEIRETLYRPDALDRAASIALELAQKGFVKA